MEVKKMKKNLMFLVALFMCVSMNAQMQTLGEENFAGGGYGGPVLKVGLVNGNPVLLSGGRGAWIINHKLALGGGSYSMVTDLKTSEISNNEKPLYMDLSYGGFEMDYIFNYNKLVHLTLHSMFGGGTLRLLEHNPTLTINNDKIFMFEPSLNVDVNINSWVRIGFGASYRYSMGLDIAEISYSDINGFSGLITLKFGSF
jgi:hypothetical protein